MNGHDTFLFRLQHDLKMAVRKQTYGGWLRIPAPVDSNRWCIPLFIFIYRLSTCFNHPFGGLSDFFFHPQYPAPNLPSSWKSYTNESPRLFATFARRAKEQFCKISEPDFDLCTSDTCKKMVYPKERRDPERGLQSWFRPAKPETRNPKPTLKT